MWGSVDIRQIFLGRCLFSNSSSLWRNEPMYGLCSLFSGVIMVLYFFSKVEHSEPILCSGSLQILLDGLRSLHMTHTLGTLGNTSSLMDARSFWRILMAILLHAALLVRVCHLSFDNILPVLGLALSP
jgi:hypothetical protein